MRDAWERVDMINARYTNLLIKIDERASRRVDVNWDKFTGQRVTIGRHGKQWGNEVGERGERDTKRMWESATVPIRLLSHAYLRCPSCPRVIPLMSVYERPG